MFHIEQIHSFLILSLKITSGEITADEQQGRAEAKETSQTRSYQSQSAHQNNFNHFKSPLQKINNNTSFNSVHQYTNQSTIQPYHHPHPEERIWAGRQPWVPDAPKIKHDKMKQFYMVDMGRKM